MIDSRTASRKEKFSYYNSLSCLVKSLEGKYTTIDLRNESYVSGKLARTDGFMNVEMEDALYCDNRGVEHVFENFFVSSRNIRYVHIPKGMSSEELMKQQLAQMAPQQKDNKSKKTYKIIRANRSHQKTLSEAFATSSS